MAKSTTDRLPVRTRSVIRRVGQKLPEHQVLKSARASGWYIIDTQAGTVIERGELEVLARRVGALQKWERVADG